MEKDPQRFTKSLKLQAGKINWEGVLFPSEFKDIDRFEKKKKYWDCFVGL